MFVAAFLVTVFYLSKQQNYVLFHTLVELFSIVIAFAVFIVTWNSRKILDNNFLLLVGISYLFIGALDLMHTLTYAGLNLIDVPGFPANQFWVATRSIQALTLIAGLLLLRRHMKHRADAIFLVYFFICLTVVLSVLFWRIFPQCFIEGVGQTPFKRRAEYFIIALLAIAALLLNRKKKEFSLTVYRLISLSLFFSVISEGCFAIYSSNYSVVNEMGHYAKLIAFFLIYKANVETGFIAPAELLFKNLRDSEEKFRTLASNLPGMVFRFDGNMQCLYSNQPFGGAAVLENIAHLDFGNAGACSLKELLTPIISDAHKLDSFRTGSFQMKSGSEVLSYAVQVIPECGVSGAAGSFLVICTDITDLKKVQRELTELNLTKDKLFSIIAHDLKNPFVSLLSYSELISKNVGRLGTDRIENMAKRINESARQAYGLLDNLLHWSSIQTGLLEAVCVVLDVDSLLEDAIRLAVSSAHAKEITLNVAGHGGLFVTADKNMVATVLRNLISNAVKFSHKGGRVTIRAEKKEDNVLFSVSDQGTGIPEEMVSELLKPGNRFSSTGTASEEGTGLGLVLCREFVNLNHGEIWLKSQLTKGTVFFFTLPAVELQ
jgi:nitrogen-specific signal transduction histidine kinase